MSPPLVRAVRRVVDHIGLGVLTAVHESLDAAVGAGRQP